MVKDHHIDSDYDHDHDSDGKTGQIVIVVGDAVAVDTHDFYLMNEIYYLCPKIS